MRKYKVLCLTDHEGHSKENSIYAILSSMSQHPKCQEVVVASRANKLNKPFFYQHIFTHLNALKVEPDFDYTNSRNNLYDHSSKINPNDFDIIFLRLPRPTTDEFLLSLEREFNSKCIINKPSGIIKCSNKAVLLNFQNVCPPIKLCNSVDEVLSFSEKHDMVLKPLKEYGGKGLVRIKGGILNDGLKDYPVLDYLQLIEKSLITEGYLAMKYLKNVNQGDKRLIVVGGEVLASSLRLPAENSWLCNISMGGTSVKTEPDEHELAIVKRINPYLSEEGILIYGADTLVDDEGNRTLSEINALSIGGFPQAERQTGRPVIKLTLDKIFTHADAQFNK